MCIIMLVLIDNILHTCAYYVHIMCIHAYIPYIKINNMYMNSYYLTYSRIDE